MTDQQSIDLTANVFDLIIKSKTISDLENIPTKLPILEKSKMNIGAYPKIEFDIKPKEIHGLIKNNILNEEFNFAEDITSNLTDPLTKILYAIAWKNGDLLKIRHIIKGILDAGKFNDKQEEAFVFHQFGKYLTKTPGQPIIDQHVIRAYSVYCAEDKAKIDNLRKLNTINKTHKPIINKYIMWLTSASLTNELKNAMDYTYYIDKILFATGKAIKFPKSKN